MKTLPPKYPLVWNEKDPQAVIQAINENFLNIIGRVDAIVSVGALAASELWVGQPSGSGAVYNTWVQNLFDLTPQDGNPSSADPLYFDVGTSIMLNKGITMGNDGSLCTWRPDETCGDDPEAYVGDAGVGYMKYPNGTNLRYEAISPSTRVMMVQHNDPPSVDSLGNTDTTGRWWQIIAPLSLYGLMDVSLPNPLEDGDTLRWDGVSRRFNRSPAGGIATTDATPTTGLSHTLEDDATFLVEARVVARQTGGTAGTAGDSWAWIIRRAVKTSGGTLTLLGATDYSFTEDTPDATFTVDFGVSTLDLLITVTGAANKDVNWFCRLSNIERVA